MFYFATVTLNMSSEQFWKTTPRRFLALQRQHYILLGIIEMPKQQELRNIQKFNQQAFNQLMSP